MHTTAQGGAKPCSSPIRQKSARGVAKTPRVFLDFSARRHFLPVSGRVRGGGDDLIHIVVPITAQPHLQALEHILHHPGVAPHGDALIAGVEVMIVEGQQRDTSPALWGCRPALPGSEALSLSFPGRTCAAETPSPFSTSSVSP